MNHVCGDVCVASSPHLCRPYRLFEGMPYITMYGHHFLKWESD